MAMRSWKDRRPCRYCNRLTHGDELIEGKCLVCVEQGNMVKYRAASLVPMRGRSSACFNGHHRHCHKNGCKCICHNEAQHGDKAAT
jgi:hypothetical protein